MIRVSVFYLGPPSSKFDLDYYINRHTPMACRLLEPLFVEIDAPVPDVPLRLPAPFVAACHLYFRAADHFRRAMAAHAQTLKQDIPNYTDLEPIMIVSEIVYERPASRVTRPSRRKRGVRPKAEPCEQRDTK